MERAIPETEPEYPFLVVDRKQLLQELSQSKIDPKKSTWIPDEKDGYVLAEIESTKGEEVTCRTEKGEVKTLKKEDCQDPNPQKYEQCTDMSDLTQLSEATILHNLRARYVHKHIYTYSGLFCVVINPYKMLPIYTESVVAKYRGKRRTEMPPHLYAVADGAFSFMLQDRENQSILITGESGAGKTENTKKVIQYFARVAAAQAASEGEKPADDKKGSLEEQIVGCNPPLEAYGNAKTVRNNNSSRFGKFIRIHFGPTGKIAGADIEHYLLEKSRVTACGKLERNYHIFYQLCCDGAKQMQEKLLLHGDVGQFTFCNQGVLTVDGIDDNVEVKATCDALDVLGFTEDDKLSLFKCVAAIMWMGEMKFKQSKDEQAEADGTGEAEKAAFLLGINATDMIKCLVKPKVKVGNEWVNKAQNKDQVVYAVATLSKSLYSRLFDWLVKKCNGTLDTKQRRQYFIGVLDIAGFEIFEFNSFEQLAINYTNERLQQFFNHHMFVLEQEEYKKEGIVWQFIDFGLDLAACIELIEKPLGILSILEEECIVPKGSDKSYVEKLYQNHMGKSPNFLKPNIKGKEKGKEPHFELKHYAGCVAYNCNGWLERNKDPINACTVELMSQSKDHLVPILFPAEPAGMVVWKQLLQELAASKLDPKKSTWIPDEKDGFVMAEIESTKGEEVTCRTEKGDVKTLKKEDCQDPNPAKFEQCTDMSDLTQLNEASILHNLRSRYFHKHIYTYSGLFCVVINPYKMLPIYTEGVTAKYRGKRRTEMPPHLYAIADGAFSYMLQDRENQSILITGESGAGKTENTKKVIQYFARVAAAQASADAAKGEVQEDDGSKKKGSLEEQIVQCNPPLEAYGNAKTVRNNNSSRFGKFIRIHFGPTGKIAGADIEHYLLEKSRVTACGKLERNYHIFYQLCSDGGKSIQDKLLLTGDVGQFTFANQGVLQVDGMDDVFEMKATSDALDVLGFTEDDKLSLFKCVAAIMWMGEMKFKQSKDEQAEADGTGEAEKAAFLLGINATDLIKCLVKPKVKVGNEWVNKSQNKDQVNYAVATLAKSLYSRLFDWLVKKCNGTLDTKNRRQYFIGVLDIAGFEIFEFNSFEQLCINYTNERLQQFFNHHMFVLEQEEYKKEGIVWQFIDFGLDLAACIELIEKPLGILSILEEECIVPKGSDKSYVEKLYQNHMGKSPNFLKPSLKGKDKDKEPHFELKHYAGCVAYNCNGWLERNKDPINACTVELMSQSKDHLVPLLFPNEPADAGGGGGKKKKGGAMQTISAAHRDSLNRLMKNLYSTHPHFVRCIIPNEMKQSWYIDAHLVLNQLKCNGVLEGIRICRKGFPNRMIYPDFKQRYTILAPNAVPAGFVDAKVVADKVLAALTMGENDYRLGHTKVFFRAGILAKLEEWREEKLSAILAHFQSHVRGFLMRRKYKKLNDQRTALAMVQRNIRKFFAFRDWKWWKMYTLIKPLLSQIRGEDEMRKKEEEFEKTKSELERIGKLAKELEEQNVTLLQQKNDLFINLQATQDSVAEMEEKVTALLTQRQQVEERTKELEDRLSQEEGRAAQQGNVRAKLEGEVDNLKGDIQQLEGTLAKAEQDKQAKDTQIRKLQDDLANQDQAVAKLSKEKKSLDENLKKTQSDLQAEEDKVSHLNKVKQKLEQTLDEMEENLNREKKIRSDVEKAKRKVEGDLKMTQDAVAELERVKRELEDTLRKKDGEINNLNGKVEEDQALIAQLQKKIKDLQRKIEELEEELEAERAARVKVEKQRAELNRELEDLSMRLDEAGGATAAQLELNKRREQELAKMRQDLEEQRLQGEQALASLRKKNQDAINELTDAVEQANKNRQKVEKEKQHIKSEVDDLHSQLEMVTKAKANAEKTCKNLEGTVSDLNAKVDEQTRSISDLQSQRSRSGQEASEFQRQLEESEHQISSLSKAKQQLSSQLDEAKRSLEDESRGRAKFQAESRNLQADLDRLRDQLEEEMDAKSAMQRNLAKSQQELQSFKARAAAGEFGGGEPSEDVRRKFQQKLQDAESQIESAMSKVSTLEKQKHKLQAELEDVTVEAERAQSLASQTEKKQKQMDKIIAEYQAKIDSLNAELEQAHRESRGFSAEVYKLKAQFEEASDVQAGLRRENKNLSDEIRELMDQLSEGGKSVHEVEKARRRLEVEKQELQAALEEAEAAIENETSKQQRMQIDMSQLRSDIERRLSEKEEENEMGRKNLQRMIESLQASLEAESRAKSDALKNKKKLESDVNELEVALDGSNRARVELEKNTKRFQQQVMELQNRCDEEARQRDEVREHLMMAERRTASVHAEVEELRASLDQAERVRKSAESELHEAADRVSELQSQNSHLASSKRKLDADIQAISSDLDDAINELKTAEEKSKRAQGEAARLADELRSEQEHSSQIERMRKQLEQQVKEMQARVDEAEASAMKGGKRQVAKMEQRVREVEAELDAEQRAHQETAKVARRAEQRLKEVIFQAEEEHKSRDRMQDMVAQLQQKLKVYKRQVEEAEELAAVNLAKYRKVQIEFEESTERADSCEQMLAKMRLQARGASASRAMTPSQR